MEIIRRHKDSKGETVGYTLRNENSELYLDKDSVIKMSNLISNAILLSNNEFRAKQGYSIDTVVNTNNLNAISKYTKLSKVQNTNIDLDYYGKDCIKVCKRIRQYAISGNLIIDTRQHKSNKGKNTHLFKLISACGLDLKAFIQGYLSVIQPYTLTRFMKERTPDKSIWLSDIGYNIAFIIKINESDKSKPLVVSFHESNIDNVFTKAGKDFSDKLCAVLVDKVIKLDNGYSVDYLVQRGFLRYNIHSATKYYSNGVAIVNYSDIKTLFNDTIQLIFEQLKSNYLDSRNDVIERKYDIRNISFMSIGYSLVNNIYLLIDLYAFYTDSKSRTVLIEITKNMIEEMPDYRLNELKLALKDRFLGSNNKLYLLIEGD